MSRIFVTVRQHVVTRRSVRNQPAIYDAWPAVPLMIIHSGSVVTAFVIHLVRTLEISTLSCFFAGTIKRESQQAFHSAHLFVRLLGSRCTKKPVKSTQMSSTSLCFRYTANNTFFARLNFSSRRCFYFLWNVNQGGFSSKFENHWYSLQTWDPAIEIEPTKWTAAIASEHSKKVHLLRSLCSVHRSHSVCGVTTALLATHGRRATPPVTSSSLHSD